MIGIRKRHPALTRGDQKVIWASDHVGSEDDAGILAFERTGGDAGAAYALVVFNTNPLKKSTSKFEATVMTTSLPKGTQLVDLLVPEKPVYTVGDAGALEISLAQSTGALLVPSDQVSSED